MSSSMEIASGRMSNGSGQSRIRTVSFSGIDGAGKSTQIRALCAFFEREGLRGRVLAFWDDVAALTRLREGAGHRVFKGDKGVGTPSAPIHRRDKNVQSPPMTCIRLGLYLLDALSLRRVMKRARQSPDDFVIFDRHIYDELANLNLRNPLLRAYAKLLMNLAPKPHLSLLLDADPAQARARKPEYPLEFLYRNRASYLLLNELSGAMTVVAPMSVDEASGEILRHATKLLPADGATARASNEISPERRMDAAQFEASQTRPAAY
jgi:thymidylate kinase